MANIKEIGWIYRKQLLAFMHVTRVVQLNYDLLTDLVYDASISVGGSVWKFLPDSAACSVRIF